MTRVENGAADGLVCRTDGRRGAIRATPKLNGVDGVEVSDDGLTLTVSFLGKAPRGLGPEHVRIDGGRRVTDMRAIEVEVEREEDPELDDRLYVTVDQVGDSSRYRLSLVAEDPYGRPGSEPFPGFDQRYHSAEFTFAPDCPSVFDCAEGCGCGGCGTAGQTRGDGHATPIIDHTARDYDTLRQLVLDRMALTTPDWVERHVPDLGMTLVELLAYTADQISYQQDAVATEAYLDTARRRVSVRRHVRLIDYPMHDGCAARAFVALEVTRRLTLHHGDYRFAAVDVRRLAARDTPEPGMVVKDHELRELDEAGSVEVFEPVDHAPFELLPAHNEIRLWTWGDERCALPAGATSATLRDEWERGKPKGEADEAGGGSSATPGERPRRRRLDLRPGDLLLLEEVRGPRSGTPGDADPTHRQVVRLTSVTEAVDHLADQPVLEVAWTSEDALTFPLYLSAHGGTDCALIPDVSVARANVVLVDHGRSRTFCPPKGAPQETIVAPPEPAVLPSCDPPPFGCLDLDAGNPPARLLNSTLEWTRSGRQLTSAQVHELFDVVGTEATGRAGIGLELAGARRRGRVVPSTAPEQAEVLETLLAQSLYPGIVPDFRPVLPHSPIAAVAPYPAPRHVSSGQAARLATIVERVRERLVVLWRGARDRDGLSDEEVDELTVLFGLGVVERVGLRRQPVRALGELLHLRERFLAAKTRRLEVLTARARAGTVLDGRTAWEIARSWGPAYAEGLQPGDAVLRGPAAALVTDPRTALPAVRLVEVAAEEGEFTARQEASGEGPVWEPRRDLLGSGPRDRHFVGELEDDGRLALRFGDGVHGARPLPGTRLAVRCRVGGGAAGNVGAGAIRHLVLCRDQESPRRRPVVVRVRNPLPAAGGTEPEPVEQVRRLAPLDLRRTRLRAVTAEDYAAFASQVPGVQRAAATIRWTGSVQEAHVAVDARGSAPGRPPQEVLERVRAALDPYRRIGHDLVVGPAHPVPLNIGLTVCAAPGHQHGPILAELYQALSARALPGGRRGFFHPDARSFGEPVRLSRLVALAASVVGVESVAVTRLHRLFHEPRGEREDGVLRLGPLEIAQCDNDPAWPENGLLEITLADGTTGIDRTTGPDRGDQW